jgi:nucleotide-binding universal stress UspA family protein
VTYATIMVHLQPGQLNTGLLAIAGDLAERFGTGVIGIAACQPMQSVEGDGYVPVEFVQADRDEIEKEIKKAEAEFRSALQKPALTIEWRSMVMLGSLADYVAREARCADLVVTSAAWRQSNVSDLVMQLGRPALIMPAASDTLKLDHVLVAWKDTRETRRATLDALPLLKKAARVTIVEIASEEDLAAGRAHLEDVANWLKSHGISAETLVSSSTANDAMQLKAIANEQDADLIVAGAYGHSRLREFVLGGVTHDLLLCANRCSFVSH